MLPGGAGRRDAATLVVTLLLLVGCFGTAVGGLPADTRGTSDPSPQTDPSPGGSTSASPPAAGTVHPDLRDVSGEVTVVVRFSGTGDAPGDAGSGQERDDRRPSRGADSPAAFEAFAAGHPGVTVERSFWVANASLVTVDTGAVALETLAAVDGVREIHPNYRIRAASAATAPGTTGAAAPNATILTTRDATGATAPDASSTPAPDAPGTATPDATTANDTGFGGDRRATYGLEMIRAPAVWERFGTRGEGVAVAVLDSGVDPSHPDVDVTRDRWAEFDDDGDRVRSTPYDSDDHGTHASATVAGGNASGTAVGVAPAATLYHGKVLDGDFGTWAAIIAGIEWAATEAEVDVISLSLGAETYQSAFVEPIRRANDRGVVVVASAGNNGEGTSNAPGNLYDTVAVGAVDGDREVAASSGGERVETADAWGSAAPDHWPDEYVAPDVTAPGVDVRSAVPGGGYAAKSGTSMAVPHVAGVVALLRAAGGDHLTQEAVRDVLARSARGPAGAPASKDTRYGAGVVDGYTATALGAADSTVTGRVVDADGDPVAGSRVDTEFGYGTTTDADGTYRLDVPSLEQTLTVEAVGYDAETVVVAPASETVRRDVELSDPALDAGPAVEPEPDGGDDAGATGSTGAAANDSARDSVGVGAESSDPVAHDDGELTDDEPDAPAETAAVAGPGPNDAATGTTTPGRATPTLGDGADPGVGAALLAALAGVLAVRRWPG